MVSSSSYSAPARCGFRGLPHDLPNRFVAFFSAASVACALVACSPRVEEVKSSAGVEHTVASTDGVSIAYEEAGQGSTALVLVHGWSCDRTYWDAQVDAFSRDHRVVTVDLGGHGASGTTRTAHTIASFGQDVAAVVNALKLDRVVLVGHSMGGDVILEAARRLPGRVAGLIWVDTYKQLPVNRTDAELAGFIAPFRENFTGTTATFVRGMFPAHADSSLVNRVAQDMAAAPPTVALSALESALRYAHDVPAVLRELKVPVVAINPDNAATDQASLRAHGVESIIVPGLGHFLMMEDPARFNTAMRTALEGFRR